MSDQPASPAKPIASSRIWILAAAALLVLAPMLLLRTLYWDDWAWYWVVNRHGAAHMAELTLQMAHPNFALPLLFIIDVGKTHAGELGRGLAIAAHIAAGVFLYRLLLRAASSRLMAPLVTAIYLLSPFYAARASISHSMLDLLVAAYLGSILLTDARHRLSRLFGMLLVFVALGYESLMALELLRLAIVFDHRRNIKDTLRICLPFWIICGLIAVSRLTWMAPYGRWAGYNQLSLSPLDIAGRTIDHADFFVDSMRFNVRLARDFVTTPVFLAICAVVAGLAAWRHTSRWVLWLSPYLKNRRTLVTLILFGALLALLGSLAYSLGGQVPSKNHFQNRLSLISQFGAIIVLAALILAIPYSRLRAATVAALLAMLTLAQLQNGKWLLYDELVQRDLMRQLHPVMLASDADPVMAMLDVVPVSHEVLYRGRCLSAQELNGTLDLLRSEDTPRSFVYEDICTSQQDPQRRQPPSCTITTVEWMDCPDKRIKLRYRLFEETKSVRGFSYLDLLTQTLRPQGTPDRMGELSLVNQHQEPVSLSASDTPPGKACEDGAAAILPYILRREASKDGCG